MVGSSELQRLERISRQVGDWVIVVARPVPVLAETSVLLAGMSRMPTYRFMLLTTLSNLGISLVYAAIGALSATLNSFLLAVAASILVPLAAILIMRKD
jgi:membrane protein DedA with SNARE-associated domain